MITKWGAALYFESFFRRLLSANGRRSNEDNVNLLWRRLVQCEFCTSIAMTCEWSQISTRASKERRARAGETRRTRQARRAQKYISQKLETGSIENAGFVCRRKASKYSTSRTHTIRFSVLMSSGLTRRRRMMLFSDVFSGKIGTENSNARKLEVNAWSSYDKLGGSTTWRNHERIDH